MKVELNKKKNMYRISKFILQSILARFLTPYRFPVNVHPGKRKWTV